MSEKLGPCHLGAEGVGVGDVVADDLQVLAGGVEAGSPCWKLMVLSCAFSRSIGQLMALMSL